MHVRPAVLLVTLAALAGCGATAKTPTQQVTSVVTRFGEASASKDYQTICDELLAPALVKGVEQYGLPCELALKKGLGDVRAPKVAIGKVTVTGDRASAAVRTTATGQVPSTDTLALRRISGEWRIAALGR